MNSIEQLIHSAKAGDSTAINSLVDRYRNYLQLLVSMRSHEYKHLQMRFDSSDVVQNTLVDAFRDLPQFKGSTEAELLAWFRSLVACNLVDLVRLHRADKRDVNRQKQLGHALSQSSQHLEQLAEGSFQRIGSTRSKQEALIMLADALACLPDDYRQVIVSRNLEKSSFKDIAVRMNRSPGAVRMLWTRAIATLRMIKEDESDQ